MGTPCPPSLREKDWFVCHRFGGHGVPTLVSTRLVKQLAKSAIDGQAQGAISRSRVRLPCSARMERCEQSSQLSSGASCSRWRCRARGQRSIRRLPVADAWRCVERGTAGENGPRSGTFRRPRQGRRAVRFFVARMHCVGSHNFDGSQRGLP